MYRLSDIRAQAGDFTLSIADFALERGEIYAVAGPNGCGKSTFLNMLGLLLTPTAGTLAFGSNAVDFSDGATLLAARRRIGYLMQNPYLFNMSVYDNLAYGLKIRGFGPASCRERVGSVMAALVISHLAGRPAHSVSGGEAQRAALARILVLDADVYLFDEPTAGVDRRNIALVEDMIRRLSAERKATVILSTHSRDQACRLSRRLISIINGRIQDVAYENVFSGELVRTDGQPDSIRIAEDVCVRLVGGTPGPVTIAIDPESILLSFDRIGSSALNQFEGVITKVENLGDSMLISVDVGVPLAAMITRKSYSELGLNAGKRVWTTFKASAVRMLS